MDPRELPDQPGDEPVGGLAGEIPASAWALCPTCSGLGKVPGNTTTMRFEQVVEIADWLDAVGVPMDWGKLRVMQLLRDNGIGVSTTRAVEAIRLRRDRNPWIHHD